MTARAHKRKKRTILVAVTTGVALVLAAVLVAVGAATLLDSEEGEAVAADERPVVVLPETPNGLLAVADRQGRLTSLVIATRHPSGAGGSIVTVPVNADADAGFSGEAVPLNTIFDPDDIDGLRAAVESMLAISIERAAVVDREQLAVILEPIETIDVEVPEDVVDSATGGTGIVASEGAQRMRNRIVLDVLTAHDEEGMSYDHHDVDAAVWAGIAATAPTLPDDGEPAGEPDTVGDLFADLWRGDVEARDLAVSVVAVDVDEQEVDAVVVDRRDSILVFAQVSPNLVSKPNPALSFRVISRFNDEQIETSDGLFSSNADLTRRFIGELLFVQGNVVSVDTAAAREGAGEVTRVEVADPRFLDDLVTLAEAAFGESEVVEATSLIEGVDVVVTLGTSYIDFRAELADQAVTDESDDEGSDAEEAPAEADSVPDDTVAEE